MAYAFEETGKGAIIKDIKALSAELGLTVDFYGGIESMSYAELIACRQELEARRVSQNWHTY